MKRATLLAFAGGTILFVLLLHHYGFAQLVAAVGVAGWGLLWVSLYRFVTLAADTAGWRVLFPGPLRPATGSLFRLRWIADAINSLLPVAQVGGDVERARLAARLGQSGAEAGATVVVDFTLGVITQLLYTLLGCGCSFGEAPPRATSAAGSSACWWRRSASPVFMWSSG